MDPSTTTWPFPLARSFGSSARCTRSTPRTFESYIHRPCSPPPFSPGRGRRRPPHAEELRVVPPPPLLDVGLLDGVEPERAARAVHDDVHPLQLPLEGGDGGVLGDVEPQRAPADLARQLLAPLDPPRRRHGLESFGGQRPDCRGPDPAAGPRDEGDPVAHGAHPLAFRPAPILVPCPSTSGRPAGGRTRRHCRPTTGRPCWSASAC